MTEHYVRHCLTGGTDKPLKAPVFPLVFASNLQAKRKSGAWQQMFTGTVQRVALRFEVSLIARVETTKKSHSGIFKSSRDGGAAAASGLRPRQSTTLWREPSQCFRGAIPLF